MRGLLNKLEEGTIANVKGNPSLQINGGRRGMRYQRSCKDAVIALAEEMGFDYDEDGSTVIVRDDTMAWELMLDSTSRGCAVGISTNAINMRPSNNYRSMLLATKELNEALSRLSKFLLRLEKLSGDFQSSLNF